MKSFLVIILFLASCIGWSKQDTAMELGFVAFTSEDWRETRTITYWCDESNPIIGKCGKNVDADLYMPSVMLLHLAVSAILPSRLRTIWQGITIGTEVNQIWLNYRHRWWEPPQVVIGRLKPLSLRPILGM